MLVYIVIALIICFLLYYYQETFDNRKVGYYHPGGPGNINSSLFRKKQTIIDYEYPSFY